MEDKKLNQNENNLNQLDSETSEEFNPQQLNEQEPPQPTPQDYKEFISLTYKGTDIKLGSSIYPVNVLIDLAVGTLQALPKLLKDETKNSGGYYG